MGCSSVFEWLCCVCSQTRLGPGPRQQGRQVQEEGFPTLETERSAEWRGVAQRRSAQAKRGRLGCLLLRARYIHPSAGLVSLHQRETQKLLWQLFFGRTLRTGTGRAEVDGAETFVGHWPTCRRESGQNDSATNGQIRYSFKEEWIPR